MIVGADLRRWLADLSAQRRSREEARAFALAWNEGPVHRAFGTAMAALPTRSAEAVVAAVRDLFEDSGWVANLVDSLAFAISRDPFFETPFRHLNSDINSGLVLYEDELVSVACATVGIGALAARKSGARRHASIHFSGQVEVVRFLKSGQARLHFWRAPRIDQGFTAAKAGQCTPAEHREIEDGETLIVDGRQESFVIEQARSNLILLQATAKPDRAPVSVEYDHATRDYVGCSAADDSASRIQIIATLLRQLGKKDAVPTLAAFLDHPSFFLRWHVMREMLGLDPQAALPHLKRMAARDPHPETRRAARTVLDRLETPPLRRRAA